MQNGEEMIIDSGDDEDEPEVLDLENPAFDVRSPDELPAEAVQTDIVDRLEFEEDTPSSNPPSTHSSLCALHYTFDQLVHGGISGGVDLHWTLLFYDHQIETYRKIKNPLWC